MSLWTCKTCGGLYAFGAYACPKCGAVLEFVNHVENLAPSAPEKPTSEQVRGRSPEQAERSAQLEEASRITNVAAFVDGWLARELEVWDHCSKDSLRDSLIVLRRAIQPAIVECCTCPALAKYAKHAGDIWQQHTSLSSTI